MPCSDLRVSNRSNNRKKEEKEGKTGSPLFQNFSGMPQGYHFNEFAHIKLMRTRNERRERTRLENKTLT